MKLLSMLFLLLLGLSLQTSSAQGQKRSVSRAATSEQPAISAALGTPQETEVQKLQRLLGQALDRITDLQKQLDSVPPLIEAMKQERLAAANERDAAKAEREAMARTIALADKAIAAQQTVIDTYEQKLVPAYDKLIVKQSARIDKLEDRVDKANRRTLWGTLGGVLVGIATRF